MRTSLIKMKRCAAVAALSLLLILTLGAGDDSARFNATGHKMMCVCGCNQILLECNHVGCPLSDGMRNELAAGMQRGDSDDLILQSFVQKYGSIVLAAPTTVGFDRVAWIMPFAVLFLGILGAMLVIRNWKLRAPAFPSTVQVDPKLLARARKETEI